MVRKMAEDGRKFSNYIHLSEVVVYCKECCVPKKFCNCEITDQNEDVVLFLVRIVIGF